MSLFRQGARFYFLNFPKQFFLSWHSRKPELRRRRSILASRPRSWNPETATSRSETRATRSSEPVICYFINCFEWLNSGKLNGYLFNVLTFKSLNTIWHFFFSIFCSLIRSIRSASPNFFCKTDNFCFYFNKIDNFFLSCRRSDRDFGGHVSAKTRPRKTKGERRKFFGGGLVFGKKQGFFVGPTVMTSAIC